MVAELPNKNSSEGFCNAASIVIAPFSAEEEAGQKRKKRNCAAPACKYEVCAGHWPFPRFWPNPSGLGRRDDVVSLSVPD